MSGRRALLLCGALSLIGCAENPPVARPSPNPFAHAPKSVQTRPATLDFLTPWQAIERRSAQAWSDFDESLRQADSKLDASLRSATSKPETSTKP